MTRKPKLNQTDWKATFIDAKLTEEQKRSLARDVEFKDSWWLHLDIVEQHHCKLSISYDWYNGGAKATLSADGDEKATFQKIFVMRGSTGSSAMIKLLYWFIVVQDAILPDARSKADIEDDSFLFE